MKRDTFAFEVWRVEFTARYLWRFLRKLPMVGKHLTPRCSHCVLAHSFSPLNAQGICKECETYLSQRDDSAKDPATVALAEGLDKLLRESQGKGGGEFDAMILFSGGKDSCYLLHRLQTEYPGLRIVTMLADNGFMSPYALDNATRALNRFDVAHWTIKLKPSLVNKVFHRSLLNIEKQGSDGYSIVDTMDAHLTFDAAKNLAARNDIPLVICGLAKVQTMHIFGLHDTFEFPPEQERGPLRDHCDLNWQEVLSEDEMKFWWDGSKWPAEKVPRFLLPYCAWDLGEDFILNEVDRLGLIEKKKSRPLMTNNHLIPVIGMAEVAKFGSSSFELEFAQMVREGKSDRNYWLSIFEMLEYSTKTGNFINETVKQTLKTLNLSKADLGIPN